MKCVQELSVLDSKPNIDLSGQLSTRLDPMHLRLLSPPQLERTTNLELCSILILLVISLSIYTFYATLNTYLRSVLLSLRLTGPPSLPFLGNCMLVTDKDCKILEETFS